MAPTQHDTVRWIHDDVVAPHGHTVDVDDESAARARLEGGMVAHPYEQQVGLGEIGKHLLGWRGDMDLVSEGFTHRLPRRPSAGSTRPATARQETHAANRNPPDQPGTGAAALLAPPGPARRLAEPSDAVRPPAG